jgi:hypothetical protein
MDAIGSLVAFALEKKVPPHAVYERKGLLEDFQKLIRSQGIETNWPGK